VAEEKSPGDFKVVQVVKTRMGASTMGLDPGSHQIYLPAAEFQEAAPGVTKRQMKPDSFMIVVVSQEKLRQQVSSQNGN
jgi:hypothetical protein